MTDTSLVTYPDIWAVREAVKSGDERAKLIEKRSDAWNAGWGTNIPLLASVVASAGPGPVLEVGSGHFSTPLLKEMCDAMGRELVVLEHDAEWAQSHADLAVDLRHVDDWTKWPIDAKRWSVVFVDNQPDTTRIANILQAKDIAEFVVIHDTLNPYFKGMDSMLDLIFKYRYDYTHMAPCTTVVSNVRPYPVPLV